MKTIIKYDSVFNELDIIAFGRFGIVCKAIEKNSNKLYAIKKVPINKQLNEKTRNEINILSELKSERIVKFESFWIENNYYHRNDELKEKLGSSHDIFRHINNLLLHIQMELCYKTLKEIIVILNKELNQKQSEVMTPLGYYISSEIFIEILESVDYLHKQNVFHRDLKPNNILITEGSVGRFVKIADFGLAKVHKTEEQSLTEYIGTDRYMAADVMCGKKYDTKMDVFSLGLIVQELFNIDINKPIGKNSNLEMNYSNLFYLIERMLFSQKNKVPNCEQILSEKKSWAMSLNQLIKSIDLTKNEKINSIEECFHMFFIQTKYHFQSKTDEESLAVYNSEKNQVLKNAKLTYLQEMDKHFAEMEFLFANELQDMHVRAKCLSHNKLETDFSPNGINEGMEEQFNNTIEKAYDEYKRQNLMNMPIKPAIGIHLGTHYSCVSVMSRGKVDIISNVYRMKTSPSYIAFTKNSKIFAEKSCKEYTDFFNRIYHLKHMINKEYNNIHIQEDIKFCRIVVLNENKTLQAKFRNSENTILDPKELTAEILSEFKSDAENFLGFEVNNAVITVPAYFNHVQRIAIEEAAHLADLNILQILNEPTAAAIAYNHQIKDSFSKNVVIYDLGESTFDVAVVVIENGIIEIKAVGGDTHLGGVDFNQRVLDFLFETFKDQFSKGYNQTKIFDRLRYHCENKIWELNEINSTLISIPDLLPEWHFQYELTQKVFEDLCIDLFKNTIKIIDETLKRAQMKASDINEVVLIGGLTKMPIIQSLLKQYFIDKPLNKEINPCEAVAYGAAIQAALLNAEKFSISNITLIYDVSPFSIGIGVSDKLMGVVIPRNTKIPTEGTQTFQIPKFNQSFILVQVFEGEHEITKHNRLLGELVIDGLPKKRAGKVTVEVTIKIDKEGILHIKGISSIKSANLTITEHSGRISADELRMLSSQVCYRKVKTSLKIQEKYLSHRSANPNFYHSK